MGPPIERWGCAARVQPLTGGHRNLVFRTFGLPRDLVFKSTRRSPEALHWLLPVQEHARAAGFVVPSLIESLEGQLVVDGWTCEAFVEGETFLPEDMPTLLPQLAAFHAATAGVVQRPGFLSSCALLAQDVGADVDLRAMPSALVLRCRAAWRAVASGAEAVIHGDLTCGNLIRCRDGRTALIDWDECRRDLVLFDLGPLRDGSDAEKRARLAWEIACTWLVEPEYAKELVRHMSLK